MDDDVLMTIIAEALGEGPEGMRRVGETILNRAAIRGLTPEQVVRQPNQFTGFFAPGPAAVAARKDPRVISAAEAAWQLAQRPGDPTGGADHYHADYVNPYWAAEMPNTGSFGRHSFYASQPVPAEALARLLVPETRNVPLPQRRPASPMDQIAALFSGSFNGNGQRQNVAAGLDQYIQRQAQAAPRAIPANDMVFGTGIADSHNQAASAAPKGLAGLLEAFSRPKAPLTTGARQTYAAQDAAAPRPAMHAMNGDDRGELVEGTTIPLRQPSSGVGQPPATRTVQSVPVPAQVARKVPLTIGAPPAYAGMEGARPSTMTGVGNKPVFGDIAMMFGAVPQPAGSTNNRKDQSRLAENDVWTVPEDERMAMHGVNGPTQVATTMPTPISQRPSQPRQALQVGSTKRPAQVRLPTPAGQRPAQARVVAMAPPAIAPRQQPLRIVVQAPKPQINPANHNIEQLRAALSGRSDYTPAGGGPSMPVYSMNGKLRNTYGDAASGSGGSLV